MIGWVPINSVLYNPIDPVISASRNAAVNANDVCQCPIRRRSVGSWLCRSSSRQFGTRADIMA